MYLTRGSNPRAKSKSESSELKLKYILNPWAHFNRNLCKFTGEFFEYASIECGQILNPFDWNGNRSEAYDTMEQRSRDRYIVESGERIGNECIGCTASPWLLPFFSPLRIPLAPINLPRLLPLIVLSGSTRDDN